MRTSFDLQSAGAIHRIIQDAAGAVDKARKYAGKVPENMDQLLELPSVGRKTANCVFVYGFKTPAIPVDTHVHRIFNRIGVVGTKTPEDTEKELTRLASRKDWLPLNEVFVKFGQLICKRIGPHCADCPLNDRCKYYNTDYLPRLKKKQRQN